MSRWDVEPVDDPATPPCAGLARAPWPYDARYSDPFATADGMLEEAQYASALYGAAERGRLLEFMTNHPKDTS